MEQVSKGLSENKEQSIFMKDYHSLHEKGLQSVENQMSQSNVRPSLIGALGFANLFQCVSVLNTAAFGEEKAKRVLSGIEKGI